MELTILMPCLNEAETLANCINKAKSFLQQEQIDGEILIADNGSDDGSQQLASLHGARVIHARERGYGAALRAGIGHAKGRYVIMGDADDSYDFSDLKPFLEKLRHGYHLVIGNRFKGKIEPGAMPFLNKYIGNPVLSFIGRLFFRLDVGDFHCGLRGFDRAAMTQLNLQSQGMEFASEMIAKASLRKLKIAETPITLSPDGRSRSPHLRKWRDGWRHLQLLLLLSPRWLFLYPGLFLTLTGGVLIGILALRPLSLGHFQLSIQTMLFAGMFFIVGLQALFFSLCSKLIAIRHLQESIDKKLDYILKQFTLNRGMVLGLVLMSCGLLGSLISFLTWADAQFGSLNPHVAMRLSIPSVVLIIAGIQIVFFSFFMSLLITHHDHHPL